MLQSSTILLLLILAVGQTLLTGRPIYHCHLTGVDSFVCGCGETEATAPCCLRCAERTQEEERSRPRDGFGSSDCDCCDVTLYRWTGLRPTMDPGTSPPEADRVEVFVCSLTPESTWAVPAEPIVDPPGGPPGFLEFHSCRC